MRQKPEDFDDYFENPDKYSDEEALEVLQDWVRLIRNNPDQYPLPEGAIEIIEARVEDVRGALFRSQEAERRLRRADEEVEEAAREYDELLGRLLEDGVKIPPMFIGLPPKKSGSH
ncbi:MAG: hypothetical protein JSS81_17660 [Acidobacteria bacterium]|nr:hypothetical protein [Acidobacteriota bacterium]